MLQAADAATPGDAATALGHARPPPAPVAGVMLRVTPLLSPVAVLPPASLRVITGCCAKALPPPAAALGSVEKVNVAAGPAVTSNPVLLTGAKGLSVAVS